MYSGCQYLSFLCAKRSVKFHLKAWAEGHKAEELHLAPTNFRYCSATGALFRSESLMRVRLQEVEGSRKSNDLATH